jgi:hypothetical protein
MGYSITGSDASFEQVDSTGKAGAKNGSSWKLDKELDETARTDPATDNIKYRN